MNATLKIRRDELAKYRVQAELVTEKRLAQAMGADRGTVNKVLNGKAKPGPDFIASLMGALKHHARFEDLFEVIREDPGESQ
ncbi:helix-turn-helix transcriptional regulator [Microtetraspora sp. AC03309]|uniref:helix-turn-helix domain-containing protein n=1 Tax=Microtetraspora sp. AC03309 TaxID=2779376 RepID=UPI001E552512|nr:helix-turn-helix transcriptional regulator [Microtetraspora sp. AC03309]MCC5574557.1 helix-turn-helix transcriptional regulator [Microtetraspora sp. AC03309]